MRRSLVAWAFLLPALVLISLSVLLPALMALVMSFTASGLDVTEPLRFVGLANLQRLLSDPMVRRVMLTTFLYLFGVVPPIVVEPGTSRRIFSSFFSPGWSVME